MIEKAINLLERESTHFLSILIGPLLNRNIFNWGVGHFEKWNFFNSNMFILIFIAGMANPSFTLWMQKGWRTNSRKSHRNWSFRSWEIWIYSWVMRFFSFLFFQPKINFQSANQGQDGVENVYLGCVLWDILLPGDWRHFYVHSRISDSFFGWRKTFSSVYIIRLSLLKLIISTTIYLNNETWFRVMIMSTSFLLHKTKTSEVHVYVFKSIRLLKVRPFRKSHSLSYLSLSASSHWCSRAVPLRLLGLSTVCMVSRWQCKVNIGLGHSRHYNYNQWASPSCWSIGRPTLHAWKNILEIKWWSKSFLQ